MLSKIGSASSGRRRMRPNHIYDTSGATHSSRQHSGTSWWRDITRTVIVRSHGVKNCRLRAETEEHMSALISTLARRSRGKRCRPENKLLHCTYFEIPRSWRIRDINDVRKSHMPGRGGLGVAWRDPSDHAVPAGPWPKPVSGTPFHNDVRLDSVESALSFHLVFTQCAP